MRRIQNERQIAVSVLMEINQDKAYNNIALRRALDAAEGLKPHQRAFITEIVNGCLRNLILIDYIINNFSRKPASGQKPFIRELLRVSVYQIRWMDKVPPSAAVNEAVKMAREYGFEDLTGFINGLLRNVVRQHESIKPSDMGLKYSFPPWLAEALINWMGADEAENFCKASHIPPPVTICVNPLKTSADELACKFENAVKSDVSDMCLHIKRSSDLKTTRAYKEGHFFVIDENAYTAAKATGAKQGDKIIDLCAAPGGKSFVMAGMMKNKGEIISCDIHPHKIKLMRDTAARLGISCIKTEVTDARKRNQSLTRSADAVLLDAPCTGFGVIRKRPDIKYTKTPADVRKLAELQRRLLAAAASYVKHGGVLVYATCTVSREENTDNVEWFLNNYPFTLDWQKLTDGFFTARLIANKI